MLRQTGFFTIRSGSGQLTNFIFCMDNQCGGKEFFARAIWDPMGGRGSREAPPLCKKYAFWTVKMYLFNQFRVVLCCLAD